MPAEGKQPDTRGVSTRVDDFPGLYLDSDPDDMPTGSTRSQVNAQSKIPGELTVRQGYREVSFEN